MSYAGTAIRPAASAIARNQDDAQAAPRSKAREDLARRALEEARSLMIEAGVEAVTARALAARLGCSPGTLYNLYESMDDIICRVNAGTLAALEDEIAAALVDVTKPVERLMGFTRVFLAFARDQGRLWKAVLAYSPAGERNPPAWYREQALMLPALMRRELAPFFASGEEELKAASARVLWSGIYGLTLLDREDGNQPGGFSSDELARLMLTYYLLGLKAA